MSMHTHTHTHTNTHTNTHTHTQTALTEDRDSCEKSGMKLACSDHPGNLGPKRLQVAVQPTVTLDNVFNSQSC